MRLIWTPEDGGEKREYSFRPLKLLSPEAEAIEEVGGRAWETFDEFGRLFMLGNRKALRAALWVMRKREEPRLRFQDLSLRVDEVATEYDDDEKQQMRDGITQNETLDPEQRQMLIELYGLDSLEESPKAPPSDSSPNATPSPTDASNTAG
jgi:hypothetical protein